MVFVHFLPGLIPEDGLSGGVAVVIDVLRATTMIVHALVAGCTEVIPVSEVEEARQIAGGTTGRLGASGWRAARGTHRRVRPGKLAG